MIILNSGGSSRKRVKVRPFSAVASGLGLLVLEILRTLASVLEAVSSFDVVSRVSLDIAKFLSCNLMPAQLEHETAGNAMYRKWFGGSMF